jgi:hypothetical protein
MSLKDMISEKGEQLSNAAKDLVGEKANELIADAKQKLSAEVDHLKDGHRRSRPPWRRRNTGSRTRSERLRRKRIPEGGSEAVTGVPFPGI